MQVKCYADGCGEIGEPLINNRNQTRCRFCYSINVMAATERDIAQDAERKRQRAAKQQAAPVETAMPIVDSPIVETATPIARHPVITSVSHKKAKG